MRNFTEKSVVCPHCGHGIRLTLDASNGSQEFYDDCPACCHAIHLNMMLMSYTILLNCMSMQTMNKYSNGSDFL